jgi:putative aldouronate transport system substrate-binding protein
MKKYGISEIKTLDDYGKYLDAVVKNDKDLDPSGMYATQHPIDGIYFFSQNLYPLTGDLATNSPFWIDVNDTTGKVVNIVDKPDLPEFLNKMKSWSDKGYWPKSVLSNKDDQMLNNGKAASLIHNMDNWVGDYIKNSNYDLKYINFVSPSYPQSYIQDAMAIPTSSKNPERALMLLEKLRTDQSYYNLLTYGIEGKNYEITSDKQFKGLDQEGFPQEQFCSWGYRDSNFKYDLVGSPSNLKDFKSELKSSSKINIYTSFNINTDPIKNEYAAVLNVMQQYYLPLKLGYVEPVSGLATLKEKLKSAGVEKVQAEIQKQLDEFVKNNK